MKKTILLGLLFFAGGNLMAQPQPGGTQIKVKTIKVPRPEISEATMGGGNTPPVKVTKPTTTSTPVTPVKSTTRETATETKNKEAKTEKNFSEGRSLDLE